MATSSTPERPATPPTATRGGDRRFALVVSAITVLLIAAIWLWTRYAALPSDDRPKPAWFGIDRVMAQMTDGRMIKLRINLQVQDQSEVVSLYPHQRALKALVEVTSSEMNRDDMSGPDGMTKLANTLQDTINGYLSEQRVDIQVRKVVFDEWTLLPS